MTTSARIVAEYQLLSDEDGRDFMTQALTAAKDAGDIADFEVTGSYTGKWGIQLVTFTVDVAGVPTQTPYEVVAEQGTRLLNEIVGDTDVVVRWVASIG